MKPAGWPHRAATYLSQATATLEHSIIPFWQRAIDERLGGVFTCWDNTGSRLVSRDKFTWSQGRFVWLWSRLAQLVRRGDLRGHAGALLESARKAMAFLRAHAFLPDGRCAFLLSESGDVKEAFPGSGPAPSVFADCFVAMGFAEYAAVSGDREALHTAWWLADSLERRAAEADCPTHPTQIPTGWRAYALDMIRLNVALVLRESAERLADSRSVAATERAVAMGERILDTFLLADGRIAELVPCAAGANDTLLARHFNPGHALEGLWMLQTLARETARDDWLQRTAPAVRFACERGWDSEQGGLLHYADADGGEPRGEGDSSYAASVRNAWSAKLWWVHSEAIYATLLSYRVAGDEAARAWFERVWEYAFKTFPHPDPAIGEWIQIRDRQGRPIDCVVALPVKDPYHVARNLVQVIELLAEENRVAAR